MTISLNRVLSPAFKLVHKAIKNKEYTQFILKGGRGSAKSSYTSIEVILQLLKNPSVHAVVMRKVANTLRTTVYQQYIWAISELGLYDKWKCTKNPPEMEYKPTGQKILFFGADDPGKIKSIKVPFGYIGILHLEEVDQFAGEEEIRNLEQSILRGGEMALEIWTFNPPQTASNWANKYCLQEKQGQMIHHSTYLTTPKEWLGDRFLSDAEHLKNTNPRAYEHEYLGKANGTGGEVFENLEIRTITDQEILRFDRIYNGQDFGWYPDPAAFVRLYYNPSQEALYLIDEIVGNKMSNEQIATEIIRRQYNDVYTICDSAEPKSISDLTGWGVRAIAAQKGPGSVEYSMKWLQRRKIVIDPKRTPKAAEEFTQYEYEKNKAGEIISGYPDKDNHCIDAVRYATEKIWRRREFSA